MINDFIYDIPVRIYFGRDQLKHLGAELKKYGTRVLMTYGGGSIKKMGLYDRVVSAIKEAGLELFELSGIEPNPRIGSVRKGVQMCKEHNIDVLLAVGGGSTIDATKIMAAGACVDHDPWDFLDLSKRAPIERALPIVSILTLAATGSEMDTAAVISNPETNDKIGRLDPNMLPKASFLDPSITFSVSPYQTACGSADILSHLFEVYFTMDQDLYMLDCFMEGLMKTVIRFAPIAMREPDNYEARANLMWASSWAINGFVNGGKHKAWSCHPMEHELSAFYDITHGLGLAILTPRWMEYCLDETTVSKYVCSVWHQCLRHRPNSGTHGHRPSSHRQVERLPLQHLAAETHLPRGRHRPHPLRRHGQESRWRWYHARLQALAAGRRGEDL